MIQEQIESIASKEDLARFVGTLRRDLNDHPDERENPTLDRYLEATESWIESMGSYHLNTGQEPPTAPTWEILADILYAAKIYE